MNNRDSDFGLIEGFTTGRATRQYPGNAIDLIPSRICSGTILRHKRQGFSLVELMVVVTVAAIVVGIAMPNFVNLLQTFRRDGAIQRIAGDLRKARSEAIRTGWQYRIFGYNNGAPSTYKNQYRLMARSSGADPWPDDTAAPFQSATQMAGQWIDIKTLYPGIRINPSDGTDRFWVGFDARGVRIDLDPSFDPLVVMNKVGSTKSVSIATVGNIRIQ